MPQVILQSAGIVTGVCKGLAASVTEHVCVCLERQASFLPGSLYEPIDPS